MTVNSCLRLIYSILFGECVLFGHVWSIWHRLRRWPINRLVCNDFELFLDNEDQVTFVSGTAQSAQCVKSRCCFAKRFDCTCAVSFLLDVQETCL